MASSSLSKRQRLIAITAAAALALLSWLYFSELWTGVIVTGAGDSNADGYYRWNGSLFVKSTTRRPGMWRVPNVYEVVSRGPELGKNLGSYPYFIKSEPFGKERHWSLYRQGEPIFQNKGEAPISNTPPATGWKARVTPEQTNPLRMKVCGKGVPDDPDPRVMAPNGQMSSSTVKTNEVAAEIMAHPVTTLFLAVIMVVAYYLWSRRVSPDAVAISYALFWEEKQYWRLFTASFSHFEPLHILFNALGTWNTRHVERMLGSFRSLYMTLDLVVTTIMMVIFAKYFLVKSRGSESQRIGKAVGYSCVLFAQMTYLAVVMRRFCPIGEALCFDTWALPMPGDMPDLPVNLGPFGTLLLAQVIMPRAGFLGHLAGILMGYLMAWRFLEYLSTPILAGFSVVFMLQHSKGWARNMPDFSLLLQEWAGGDSFRVKRARMLSYVWGAHLCLTLASMCLLTWSSVLAEVLALVVGFNAMQALKCCCCPDSVPAEHRYCVNLLKAYGVLSAILVVGDMISFGAILAPYCFLEWSGVSETSRHLAQGLLVVAALVHSLAVLVCMEGVVMFRDGQAFLSNIGLGSVTTNYSINSSAATGREGVSGAPYASAAGITSGSLYRGGGRVLGTAASNRAHQSLEMGETGWSREGTSGVSRHTEL